MADGAFDLRVWIGAPEEQARATTSLVTYLDTFAGGQFDLLADTDSPNSITARDIVAVSTLSVQVPARVAAWLLHPDGTRQISELLEQVSPAPIWAQDASVLTDTDGPLTRLWVLLQDDRIQLPPKAAANDVGPVIAGKLLAAKRPHLVPIWDVHVSNALRAPAGGWWRSWRSALSDADLRAKVDAVRAAAARDVPGAADLSDLRVLDIVVWMREHGWSTVRGDNPAKAWPPVAPSAT